MSFNDKSAKQVGTVPGCCFVNAESGSTPDGSQVLLKLAARQHPDPMLIPCSVCKLPFRIHSGETWQMHAWICAKCSSRMVKPQEFTPMVKRFSPHA